jgi:hypothetical protein
MNRSLKSVAVLAARAARDRSTAATQFIDVFGEAPVDDGKGTVEGAGNDRKVRCQSHT